MKSITQKIALGVLITGITASSVFAADADGKRKHPRRAEVKKRANNEEAKNNAAAKTGAITQKQANKLNREDQAIKRESNADAAANGGHITKGEQRDLNRQENQVNRQRNRDEKKDASATGGAASAPVNPTGQ